jgi:integrase
LNSKNGKLTPNFYEAVIDHLRKNGTKPSTLYSLKNQLKHLDRYTDIHDPEKVKDFISKKNKSDSYKLRLCVAYNCFCKYYKIQWEMPYYQSDKKMPKLPTEEQIKTLIAGAGKSLSLKLRLSLETGIRPTELCSLKVQDLDIGHTLINPTTAKHGCARALKISLPLAQDLQTRIIQMNLKPTDNLFGKSTARHYGTHYREMRKTLAKKLNKPDLLTVRLYDFRHFFGTMRYWKYRDVPLTAQDMGHRDYNTTSKYLHLCRILELMTNSDQWLCKAVQTKDEASPLIETGWQYVNTTPDGFMLYRKPK